MKKLLLAFLLTGCVDTSPEKCLVLRNAVLWDGMEPNYSYKIVASKDMKAVIKYTSLQMDYYYGVSIESVVTLNILFKNITCPVNKKEYPSYDPHLYDGFNQ